jgi:hypothetical protein
MPNEDPSQPEELTQSPPELDRENVPHLPAARNTDEQSDGTIVVTCPAMACPVGRGTTLAIARSQRHVTFLGAD